MNRWQWRYRDICEQRQERYKGILNRWQWRYRDICMEEHGATVRM